MSDTPSAAPGLFSDTELPRPARGAAMQERLAAAYRDELLANPPVDSVDPAKRGEGEARATAERIARREDVPRLLRAVRAAGMEICYAGRMAELKEIIADFLTLGDCEADWDDLLGRARAAIAPR